MTALFDKTTLLDYLQMGGFVMPPLALASVVLWYALVWRWLSVRGNRENPRNLVVRAKAGRVTGGDITSRAVLVAMSLASASTSKRDLKSRLDEALSKLKAELDQYRTLVRALVAVAPLLGLLGTVDGMIETFRSLGDMALFSQSGGIAGGISKALFTTQIGLVISIPGLLLGRVVERKQRNIERALDQIKDLVCTQAY